MKMLKAEVKIFRWDPKVRGTPFFQNYQVPYSPGEKVLSALIYIYKNFDPCFSFRFNCRGKHCGECSITINGRPGLACSTPMSQTIILEPLKNLPLLKDLVINKTGVFKKVIEQLSFFSTIKDNKEGEFRPYSMDAINRRIQLENCIHCLCCMSVCPIYIKEPDKFIGPLGIIIMASNLKNNFNSKLYELINLCVECGLCEEICPRNIPILKEGLKKIKG